MTRSHYPLSSLNHIIVYDKYTYKWEERRGCDCSGIVSCARNCPNSNIRAKRKANSPRTFDRNLLSKVAYQKKEAI